jgi:hypothetical protein
VAAADKNDQFPFKRPPRAVSFMRWLGRSINSRKHNVDSGANQQVMLSPEFGGQSDKSCRSDVPDVL